MEDNRDKIDEEKKTCDCGCENCGPDGCSEEACKECDKGCDCKEGEQGEPKKEELAIASTTATQTYGFARSQIL